MFSVRYEKIKFLVIALKNAVEVYAWAPKPYHKFMAFKVGNVPVSSVYSRTVGVSAINTTVKNVLCFCHQQLKLLIVHATQFLGGSSTCQQILVLAQKPCKFRVKLASDRQSPVAICELLKDKTPGAHSGVGPSD